MSLYTEPFPSPATLRAALAARCGENAAPVAWRPAVAAAGVTGADAFLCHLSRSINAALECLTASAEVARDKLRSVRNAASLEDNSRFDELEAAIDTAEYVKIAALERELCTVDAALESYRAAWGVAAEAVASLCDSDLEAQHTELTARLDSSEAQLLALPMTVVEPPHVGLSVDALTVVCGCAFGRVVAPRAITAADLSLQHGPLYVHPGTFLRLRLALKSDQHASQSYEDLQVSLQAAAAATLVDASLEAPGAAPLPLQIDANEDALSRCVSISCAVPLSASEDASVCVSVVTVSGHLTAGVSGSLSFPIRRGVRAPLRLKCTGTHDTPFSMGISLAGQLFVPQYGSNSVLAFDSDRAPQPSLAVAGLGLGNRIHWSAFANGESPSVLLADTCVVAVDPTSQAVRWATAPGLLRFCCGLAALPEHDIVVAANADETLFAHRLSNGERVGSLVVPGLGCYLAADPLTGAIFGNGVPVKDQCAIACFSWTVGSGLKTEGFVDAAGLRDSLCPLTVVPPAPGKRVSHLVVGTRYSPELLVLALPGLALVHRHVLRGIEVSALAADPWGAALAVGDASEKEIRVFAWPLSGMPALE